MAQRELQTQFLFVPLFFIPYLFPTGHIHPNPPFGRVGVGFLFLCPLQRLPDVVEYILDVLYSDREADEVGGHAGLA